MVIAFGAPAVPAHSFSDHQVASRRASMTRRTFGRPCSPPPDGASAPLRGGPYGPRPSGGHEKCLGLAASRLTFVFQPCPCNDVCRIAPGKKRRPARDASPNIIRWIASRCLRGRRRHHPSNPEAAIAHFQLQRTADERNTDSDWVRSSRPPAAAHHRGLARRSPGSIPMSSCLPRRARIRAAAIAHRARLADVAQQAGARKTVPDAGRRAHRGRDRDGARYAAFSPANCP